MNEARYSTQINHTHPTPTFLELQRENTQAVLKSDVMLLGAVPLLALLSFTGLVYPLHKTWTQEMVNINISDA